MLQHRLVGRAAARNATPVCCFLWICRDRRSLSVVRPVAQDDARADARPPRYLLGVEDEIFEPISNSTISRGKGARTSRPPSPSLSPAPASLASSDPRRPGRPRAPPNIPYEPAPRGVELAATWGRRRRGGLLSRHFHLQRAYLEIAYFFWRSARSDLSYSFRIFDIFDDSVPISTFNDRHPI